MLCQHIRWWVLLPLGIFVLESLAELTSRFWFAAGVAPLGWMFYYVAAITFLANLPALLVGMAYFGKATMHMTDLWFWLAFLPSLALSMLLYGFSCALHTARKFYR